MRADYMGWCDFLFAKKSNVFESQLRTGSNIETVLNPFLFLCRVIRVGFSPRGTRVCTGEGTLYLLGYGTLHCIHGVD